MAYAPSKKDHDRHFDIVGFAPDVDVDIPGAASIMSGVIPSDRGWRAAPGLDVSADRYPQMVGGYAESSRQAFFSWSGHMILRVGTQFIRHSQASTANNATGLLGVSTSIPAAFLDFGNNLLVATGSSTIAALSNTTFVAIDGAPSAQLLLVGAARFVVAFGSGNTNWRCSARDNHASWTLNPATLAASGSLPGQPNDNNKTAAALGDDIILFKGQTAYRGRFVPGHEEVWVFERLPLDINALYCRASCSYKQGILVLAEDGLYFYDGATLTNLLEGRLSRWFAKRVLGDTGTYHANVVVDEIRGLIWVTVILYDSDELTTYSTKVLICDPKDKRWSMWNGAPIRGVESGFHYYPGNYEGTVGRKRTGLRMPWALDSTLPYYPREIAATATVASVAQITLSDFGDAFIDTEVTRANLKFTRAPTGALPTATHMHRNTLDAALSTAAPTARATDGLFDIRRNARWHRLQFDLYGDFELSGYAIETEPTGKR